MNTTMTDLSILPDFDDPLVQKVYDIICDDMIPPDGEHWDGFVSRRIVALMREMKPVDFKIYAQFETRSSGLIGTTLAPISRIEQQDDGSVVVIIDHWPR